MKKTDPDIYILSDKKADHALNLPLLQIDFLTPTIDITQFDILIFTSKNGVEAIEHFDQKWKDIPCCAISSATAKTIQKYGANLVFTGNNGHGNTFAKELLHLLKDKKALYIKAKKVVSNLENILKENNIDIQTVDLYETSCKKYEGEPSFHPQSYFVFSSPSTIECFMKNFTWQESFTAVSIGLTTLKYFPSFITPIVANTTSLESCVQKAKEHWENKNR